MALSKVGKALLTLFSLGVCMILVGTGFGLVDYFVGTTPAHCRIVGHTSLKSPAYVQQRDAWVSVSNGKTGYLVELTTHKNPVIANETFLIEDQSSWLTSLHLQEKMKTLPVNKTFECTYLKFTDKPCLHSRVYCALLGTGTLDDWVRPFTLLMAPLGVILCFSVLVGALVNHLMYLSTVNAEKAAEQREVEQAEGQYEEEHNFRQQQRKVRRPRRRRDGYEMLMTV